MIYAVFTTPENSIGASALCAFSLADIVKTFDGHFKGQTSEESNWLPVPASDVPIPRPAACHSDSSYLPDAASVAFHKEHPLMDEAVQGTLTLVYPSNPDRFRVVEVDPSPILDSTRTPSSSHILYIGTESGKVLKVIVDNTQNSSRQRRHQVEDDGENYSGSVTYGDPTATFNLNFSFISASWKVSERPIKTLRLMDSGTLLVGTETQVLLLPTSHCTEYESCRECIHLRDPHCYWDIRNEACTSVHSLGQKSFGPFDLRQDIKNGDAQFCPPGKNQIYKKMLSIHLQLHADGWRESDKLYELESTEKPDETELTEGGQLEQEARKSEGEECCQCTLSTVPPIDKSGNDEMPELGIQYSYPGSSQLELEFQIPSQLDTNGNGIDSFQNRIPEIRNDEGKPSHVEL